MTQNFAKVFELYEKSAAQKYLLSYVKLGQCYELGTGTPKDEFKAYSYYK